MWPGPGPDAGSAILASLEATVVLVLTGGDAALTGAPYKKGDRLGAPRSSVARRGLGTAALDRDPLCESSLVLSISSLPVKLVLRWAGVPGGGGGSCANAGVCGVLLTGADSCPFDR
jgi:hypothetical protein